MIAVGRSGRASRRRPTPIPSSTWNGPWLTRLGIDRHAGLVHRGPEPVDPGAAAQDAGRPADDADPTVAEGEQMTGRGQAAVPVRGPDRRRVVERLPRRIDDRERDPTRPELVTHRLAEVREHGDDAHGPARQRALDPALAGPSTALHLGQDDGQLVAPGDPLDAADDLQGPFALELVEDELQQLRPTSGTDRPLVVMPADDRLDPTARRRGHVRPPVEDLRDRRRRDAGLAGDHRERRPVPAGPAFLRRHGGSVAPVDRKFRRQSARGIATVPLGG